MRSNLPDIIMIVCLVECRMEKDMHSLPYELPENGKIFYLLSDSEVNSFNYYKQHGSDHGLDVSLKMAVTEFGRVLTVQVKKVTNVVKRAISKVATKLDSTKQAPLNKSKNKLKDQSLLSKVELARKQGVPESLIESYISDKKNNEAVKGLVCFGMYREKNHQLTQVKQQNPPEIMTKPLTLFARILIFLKRFI